MVKSLFGNGNLPTTVALAAAVIVAVEECGESPLDDGDMLLTLGTLVSASKEIDR